MFTGRAHRRHSRRVPSDTWIFWDPLEPQPHDPDVKALVRMAVGWNIPIACNRASADFMISSPLMDGEYLRRVPDYEEYRQRKVNWGDGSSDVESSTDLVPMFLEAPTAEPSMV